MLDLLFYDNIELPKSNVRREEDGGDASYLKGSPLHSRIVYLE